MARRSEREVERLLEQLETEQAPETPEAWVTAIEQAAGRDDSAWSWGITVNADPDDDPDRVTIRERDERVSLSVPRSAIPDRFDADGDFPVSGEP